MTNSARSWAGRRAAPAGRPSPPEDELAPRWAASHHEGVTIGELPNRLDDTLHEAAENREGVSVMVVSSAGVPHLRAGLW